MEFFNVIDLRFLVIILVLKYNVLIQGESVDSGCSAFGGTFDCDEDTNSNSSEAIGYSFESNHVEYWIYTRERPNGQLFDRDSQYMVESTTFNNSKPTKVMVHGWMGETVAKQSLCLNTKDSYLHIGDYNIICVKWTVLIIDANYANAVLRVKPIGNDLAEIIEKLTKNTKDGVKNFHLVGHSLGAHIVGFAGKKLNRQIPRITGLDPAKPLYELAFPSYRIADTDAKFVDIIHTNGGKLGLNKPLGKIDFYPNGGKSQPQCILDITGACSHLKAIHYFANSIIEGDEFESIQCSSWKEFQKNQCDKFAEPTSMGEYVDQNILEGEEFKADKCSSWKVCRKSPYDEFADTAFMGEYVDHKKTGKYYLDIVGSYQQMRF